MAGCAAHVDDRAAAGFQHLGNAGLRAVKRAIEHDRDGFAPLLGRDFNERFHHVHDGAVDENVDATERIDCCLDHLFDRGRIGHVADMADGASAGRLDFGDQ